jgi:hypothetical protein
MEGEKEKREDWEFMNLELFYTKYEKHMMPAGRYYFNVFDEVLYTKRKGEYFPLKLKRGCFYPTDTEHKQVGASAKYLKIQLNITANEKNADDFRDEQRKKKAFKAWRERVRKI